MHSNTNSIIYSVQQTYLDKWKRQIFRCWPKFTNEVGKAAAVRLNAYYEAKAAQPYNNDHWLIQPNEMLIDSPIFTNWYEFLLFDLELQSDCVIVYFYGDSYTGGAHPAHFYWADVFDRATGRKLALTDVLNLEASAEAINQAVIEHMEKVGWPLSEGESYDIREKPEQNFAIAEQGITLIFGEYEIGPYAAGIIEVPIAWNQLTK